MKVFIYDYEVFKYDTLLGLLKIDLEKDSYQKIQTWELAEIRKIYFENVNDTIWIGWNSNSYDDLIYEAIINGKDPYKKSKELIGSQFKPYCRIKLFGYDLTNPFKSTPSLKITEALCGDSIETSDIDFDLDRPLTEEEKRETEEYNTADLLRTYKNLKAFYSAFELRLNIISEFNIPLQEGLRMTGTQIAAAALGAKRNPALAYMPVKPQIYPTMQVKNQELVDWYLSESFRNEETKDLLVKICNTEIKFAAGGAHSRENKYHCKKAIYADISGYYNLVMMNFDLLPRTLDEEGKKKYNFMYHEQLRLKKINPTKRQTYKTICLSVFGAMNNEKTDFYDPYKALLVTTTGEMFMMDLLEKLDGLGTAFNVNTDGIMFDPFDWANKDKILAIIDEWVNRNGFAVKTEIITDYHGRDVNCYMMKDPDGELVAKGDSLKNYDISDKAFAAGSLFNCKEPPIVAQGVVAAFIDGIMPEEFVKKNADDLKLYQYICRKNTFQYMAYKTTYMKDLSTSEEKIKSPSRCFASKISDYSGMIFKHKINKSGIHQSAKVSNLPDNVFIWNTEILSDAARENIKNKLDYDYYVNRIYTKINEFL